MAAARKAFAGVLAVHKAVEIAEIFGAVTFAAAGAGELPGVRKRVLHPVGRRRMAGEKIEQAWIGAAGSGLEIGVALHVGQESRRAIRVKSRTCRNADTDAVGLEFLSA